MHRHPAVSLTILALALVMNSSQAAGLGAYGSISSGSADWDVDSGNQELEFDGDTRRANFGFVMDTAPAQDRLFNYRLNVGVEDFEADWDDSSLEMDLVGISVDNTFGFGVLRTDTVRLWVGQRVRVGYYAGDLEPIGEDIYMVELGVGGAVGANFNVGPRVSLGLTAGIMHSGYGGVIDFAFEDEDITGDGGRVFVNGVFMVRIGGDAQ